TPAPAVTLSIGPPCAGPGRSTESCSVMMAVAVPFRFLYHRVREASRWMWVSDPWVRGATIALSTNRVTEEVTEFFWNSYGTPAPAERMRLFATQFLSPAENAAIEASSTIA